MTIIEQLEELEQHFTSDDGCYLKDDEIAARLHDIRDRLARSGALVPVMTDESCPHCGGEGGWHVPDYAVGGPSWSGCFVCDGTGCASEMVPITEAQIDA